MSSVRVVAVLCVLLAVFSSVCLCGVEALNVENDAVLAVEEAEAAVIEAFGVVVEAEHAGGNVSDLLRRLDVAGGHLAVARMSLKGGDFDVAAGNASLCLEAVEGVVGDAEVLRDRAARESGERTLMSISGSILGVVVAVCGSFLGWNWFKKRYYERVLKMKPKVAEE